MRRIDEESEQINAQAAAISLMALQCLTTAGKTQTQELNTQAQSLKTSTISTVIKISNIFDREEELTAELYEEIYDNMEEELEKIPFLKRIKIIRNGEEKLGAEVGTVFVEF